MTKRQFLLTPLLLGGLLVGNLSAAPIFGSFKATGTFEVTTTDIFWLLPAPERFVLTLGTDSFAGLGAVSVQMIHNLNVTAQPVGTEIDPPTPFIEFLTDPTLPPLMLTFIHPAVLPSGVSNSCGSLPLPPPVGGQFCIPPGIPGGSPFLIQNLDFNTSLASFRVSGITGENAFHKEGESNWTGVFTLPFNNRSFQTVLKDLAVNGSVKTSYSGDFDISIAPIPEPGTFALIGMGLIMATVAAKRLKKRPQA
jgi:hypothetical protein